MSFFQHHFSYSNFISHGVSPDVQSWPNPNPNLSKILLTYLCCDILTLPSDWSKSIPKKCLNFPRSFIWNLLVSIVFTLKHVVASCFDEFQTPTGTLVSSCFWVGFSCEQSLLFSLAVLTQSVQVRSQNHHWIHLQMVHFWHCHQHKFVIDLSVAPHHHTKCMSQKFVFLFRFQSWLGTLPICVSLPFLCLDNTPDRQGCFYHNVQKIPCSHFGCNFPLSGCL